MKLIGRTLTLLLMTVMLLAAMAQAQYAAFVIKVNVPFEFNVGAKSFPAGNYSVVRTAPSTWNLRDSQARVVATMVTSTVQANVAPTEPKLDFEAYNGRHFLTSVWTGDSVYGSGLIRGKRETQMAKAGATQVEIVADKQP